MTQTAWRVEEKKTQSTSTDHRLKGLTLKHKNLFGVLSNILRQTCCEHLASTLSIIKRLHLHPVFCEPFASHIFPLCHFSAEPLGHLSYSSTKPTFVFILFSGGNKLSGQQFRLDWAWISLEKEYYVVDEEDKHLDVVLRRRGYLGETSFIG